MTNKTLFTAALAVPVLAVPALAVLLVLASALPANASPLGKKASAGLITLATTGNPKPLRKELGGKISPSSTLKSAVASLLNDGEHLAPSKLTLKNGDVYAMVAPTITKDNFVYIKAGSKAQRFDVGHTEGTNIPFVVTDVVEDGGAGVFEQLGHWWDNL